MVVWWDGTVTGWCDCSGAPDYCENAFHFCQDWEAVCADACGGAQPNPSCIAAVVGYVECSCTITR